MLVAFLVAFGRERSTRREAREFPVATGLSMVGQAVLENVAWLMWGTMVATVGPIAAAGHGVALTILTASFSVGYGIRSAVVTVLGELSSTPDPKRLTRVARRAVLMGMVGEGSITVLIWVLRGVLVPLLTNSSEVAALVDELLLIGIVFMFFDGSYLVLVGVLRGLSDVRWPATAFFVVGSLGFAPLAWILCIANGMGAPGAWWAASIFAPVISLVLALRTRWRIRELCSVAGKTDG